jgi:Delta24-sterol reductase
MGSIDPEYYQKWMFNRHKEDVEAVSTVIKDFYSRKVPFRIYHGSTNSTRGTSFDQDTMIDISDLKNVVKLDIPTKTVLVEPNVPMDDLVQHCLRHGLIPPVVMEFPGITVGGGFAGTAGESSSFKHGFFDATVNAIEMVLANGQIVNANKDKNPDLFYGAAGTCGTLGVTTMLELQLINAKKYVEVTYTPVNSVASAISTIEKAITNPINEYVDGILFSPTRGVIMTGHLTNIIGAFDDDVKIVKFTAASDPWFYLHAESVITASPTSPTVIAIPVTDYLFRYDRGAFWTGRYAFSYFLTPFNKFTRMLLDPFLHARPMYRALHASGHAEKYVIQDMALPSSKAKEFLSFVDQTLKIYPLWLCPLKKGNRISMHPNPTHAVATTSKPAAAKTTETLLNVGIWGPGPKSDDPKDFIAVNRALEMKLRGLGGLKWLYAHTFYTEEEFWSLYDKKWYDALREKYGATSLPTVYEKVKTDMEKMGQGWSLIWRIWPFSGLWGVLVVITGGDVGFVIRYLGVAIMALAMVVAFRNSPDWS